MHPGIGPSSSEAAGPETSGSRYHLGVALGEGGFGSVYLAELEGQQGFRKRVALKILHGAADARKSTLRRFRDEARLLGLLEHHAIVGVHGLVELDGQWAVVMEYLPGVDLEFVVEHGGALGCGVAARVGLSAAGALDFAWRSAHPSTQEALGLEHRDIKPANLLMTRAGALKVLDFGIARARFAQREAKTLRQGAMGTPPYMPPERWLGRGGHESDVFSLATTVLFLATGRGLPEASSIDGYVTWRAAMMADLRGLEGGEVLAEVLAPALVDDPAGRPTAADMRVSLRAVTKQLGGETLEEWADERLPPMIAAREAEMGPGPLTGKVLTEGASTDGAEAESLPSGTWMPEMDDEPAGADGATSATLAPATVEPPRAEERASSPLRAWVVGAASLGGLALVVLWAATRLAAPPLLPPTVEPSACWRWRHRWKWRPTGSMIRSPNPRSSRSSRCGRPWSRRLPPRLPGVRRSVPRRPLRPRRRPSSRPSSRWPSPWSSQWLPQPPCPWWPRRRSPPPRRVGGFGGKAMPRRSDFAVGVRSPRCRRLRCGGWRQAAAPFRPPGRREAAGPTPARRSTCLPGARCR